MGIRWTEGKARSSGGGFKLFCHCIGKKRDRVRIILNQDHVNDVMEMKRLSGRIKTLKMEIDVATVSDFS